MVKLVVLVIFLLAGNPVDDAQYTLRQKFDTVAECEAVRTSTEFTDLTDKLREALAGAVDPSDADEVKIAETKCIEE